MELDTIKQSKYLKIYTKKMKQMIIKTHPNWDDDKVEKKIQKMIASRIKNPEVVLDNNHTKQTEKSDLLSVFDWALERKPIMAGNATFYKQHKESPNPNAEMVDGFLIDRKKLKKILFTIEDNTSRSYKDIDLSQNNKKKLANSYYGCSGSPLSPFYSKWSAIATTASAQAGISTTMTTFEAFLTDNFIFINFNECIEWLHTVIKEDVAMDDWVVKISKVDCYKRILNKCFNHTKEQAECLWRFMDSCTEEEVTRIYWKNNLHEFTETHKNVKALHDKIFASIRDYQEIDENDPDGFSKIPEEFQDRFAGEKNPVHAWNNFVSVQKFYDPNEVPDTIEKYLNLLRDIYMKYVYIRWIHLDRIYRLKNFRRRVVTVIDTDSNILSLDIWMRYCEKHLMTSDYGRSVEDNTFVAINTITYIIGAVVNQTLLYFGECANVEEKLRSRYNMKNEFYFARLIVAKGKKRYLSRIVLREGKRLKKAKFDVKGFDFKKSGVSEEAQMVFMSIVKENLLHDGDIQLSTVLNRLNAFRQQIIQSIRKGETKYLPKAQPKELDAYADPSSEQGVRGVLTWNLCEPEKAVEFPAHVSILKLTIDKEEQLQHLKGTQPELYQRLVDGIFHDKTKIFVKPKKNNKGQQVDSCIGMGVICIPVGRTIPDYIMEYIDYRTITNNILSPFNSVLDAFGLPGMDEGKTGTKTNGLSNIIRL